MYFELRDTPPDMVNFYFHKLNERFRFFPILQALQYKSDYGFSDNLYQEQMLAKSFASDLARILGVNTDKAEVVTAMAGSYFPPEGHWTKNLMMDYLKDHDIEISEEDLPRVVLEFAVLNQNILISRYLDEMLKDVFALEKPLNISVEAAIARYCQDIIKKARVIQQFSDVNWSDLIHQTIKEATRLTKEHHALIPVVSLEERYEDVAKNINYPPLPDDMVKYLIKGMDIFSKREKNYLYGIARFAAYPGPRFKI